MLLLALTALGAEVDRGPSGTIVTVRPEEGETACILDGDNAPIELCSEFSKPYWLVHPDAWRNAVAIAEGANIDSFVPDELVEINTQLEAKLSRANTRVSELTIARARDQGAHEEYVKSSKKKLRNFVLLSLGAGAVAGTTLTAAILL